MKFTVDGHKLVVTQGYERDVDHIVENKRYYTVGEIIEIFDVEYRNEAPVSQKLRILEEVERLIQNETINTHKVVAGYDERAHFENWGTEQILYAYAPYHMVYVYYLAMRISGINNDTKRFNTYSSMYNDAMITFQQQINKLNRVRNAPRTKYINLSKL